MHVLICYIWFDNKVRFCVSWNHFIMKSYSLEYHLTTKTIRYLEYYTHKCNRETTTLVKLISLRKFVSFMPNYHLPKKPKKRKEKKKLL